MSQGLCCPKILDKSHQRRSWALSNLNEKELYSQLNYHPPLCTMAMNWIGESHATEIRPTTTDKDLVAEVDSNGSA